jgi:sulfide:quinone oxidoreductase
LNPAYGRLHIGNSAGSEWGKPAAFVPGSTDAAGALVAFTHIEPMESVRTGSSAPVEPQPLASDRGRKGRFRVVIAGGGVAGLEALLALRQLATDRVAITLVAPTRDFSYRPLSVAEPFERSRPRAFALDQIALENHSGFRRAGLASIDDLRRQVTLTDGSNLTYDALLLAIGAEPAEGIAGAITFGGSADAPRVREVLEELERGVVKRVAFAIPEDTWWPIGAYELALQTAHRLREWGIEEAELRIVSAEQSPMALFGARASRALATLLDEAGIVVVTSVKPQSFDGGRLTLAGGRTIECDRVIALPVPHLPAIPGLRGQQHRGLIATDRFGGVLGMERVFAAGDATWFPIKQGGLAAQQADAAATAIGALAGSGVDPQPFRPILRGAVLTGEGPVYMRADPVGGHDSAAARSILWWPPAKIAGRLLAPYLAAKAGYRGARGDLTDLEAPIGEDPVTPPDHEDVVALAFASADANARFEDYRAAMRWLEVAEDLELHLPTEYELKRISWQERANARR